MARNRVFLQVPNISAATVMRCTETYAAPSSWMSQKDALAHGHCSELLFRLPHRPKPERYFARLPLRKIFALQKILRVLQKQGVTGTQNVAKDMLIFILVAPILVVSACFFRFLCISSFIIPLRTFLCLPFFGTTGTMPCMPFLFATFAFLAFFVLHSRYFWQRLHRLM